MAYLNAEEQKEYQKKHYLKHKEKYLESQRKRRNERVKWCAEIKSKLKCEKCGFNHIAALHFHHKDKKEKFKSICTLVRNGSSEKKILDEIDKCIVLCANCHAIHHFDNDKRRCKD